MKMSWPRTTSTGGRGRACPDNPVGLNLREEGVPHLHSVQEVHNVEIVPRPLCDVQQLVDHLSAETSTWMVDTTSSRSRKKRSSSRLRLSSKSSSSVSSAMLRTAGKTTSGDIHIERKPATHHWHVDTSDSDRRIGDNEMVIAS